MRYVSPGVVVDVSEAVHRMFSHDIDPQLDPKIFVEGNDFRRKYAYIEEVDVVLRKHEDSLRLIFERACRMRGQNAARGIANKLVSFECWRDVCRLFNLVDVDLTERDATLAFVWSRMRVVDEQADRGRIQLTHLSFEDFVRAAPARTAVTSGRSMRRIAALAAHADLDRCARRCVASAAGGTVPMQRVQGLADARPD